jgi:hypothetical protein
MKNIIIKLSLLLLVVIVATSCKKNGYLDDGGVSVGKSDLSTYDYLKSNRFNQFDTTLLLIDHFNLKDSVNKAGTFFAVNNFSIHAFMVNRNLASLDELYQQLTSKALTQYMFSEKITLDASAVTAKIYSSWADTKCGVVKIQQNPGEYPSNGYPVYQLNYIKINGELDGSPSAPPGDPVDFYSPCQTTGIETSSGTTLHALKNNAIFNKL